MKIKDIKTTGLATAMLFLCALGLQAQNDIPIINPTIVYTDKDGAEVEATEYSGEAPFKARFEARADNTFGWTTYYEWHFTKEGEGEAKSEPYLIRYEEDTEVNFSEAGSHKVELYAIFTQGNDSVCYTEEYWSENTPLTVTISESKLDMPNAFSPNNDGLNDVYKAKSYQSLVEFHAAIYNRWGQKLYEWDNPAEGWDGTYNGKDVKDGVYFVNVSAKGSDGRKYNIRRDVNLLRGYTETGNSNPSE